MLAADLLVIPVQPSPYDVWAAEETLKLVEEATVLKDLLKSVTRGLSAQLHLFEIGSQRGQAAIPADPAAPPVHSQPLCCGHRNLGGSDLWRVSSTHGHESQRSRLGYSQQW